MNHEEGVRTHRHTLMTHPSGHRSLSSPPRVDMDSSVPKSVKSRDLRNSRRVLRPPGKPEIRVAKMTHWFLSLSADERAARLPWVYAMLYVRRFKSSDTPPDWVEAGVANMVTHVETQQHLNGVATAYDLIVRFAIKRQKEIADGEIDEKHCMQYILAIMRNIRQERSDRIRNTRRHEKRRERDHRKGH